MRPLFRAFCAAAATAICLAGPALAQTRNETLLVVVESGTNSLDIHTDRKSVV